MKAPSCYQHFLAHLRKNHQLTGDTAIPKQQYDEALGKLHSIMDHHFLASQHRLQQLLYAKLTTELHHLISKITVESFKEYFDLCNDDLPDDDKMQIDYAKLQRKGTPTWRYVNIFPGGHVDTSSETFVPSANDKKINPPSHPVTSHIRSARNDQGPSSHNSQE